MEIVLLVAGALMAVAAGVIGLSLLAGRRARDRFEAHVDACHARLGAAEKRLAEAGARAAAYPRDLPAPFASARQDLDTALGHARRKAADLQRRRRALLHGAGQPAAGTHLLDGRLPVPRPLLGLLDEPHRWRRLDAEAAGIERVLAEVEEEVTAVAAALARLEKVPAEVTRACAGLATRAGQAVAVADDLARRGAHGAALDRAAATARDLAGRLGTVSTATPRDTVAAFELFELLSVPVAEVHAQLTAWAGEARRLDQALADARDALDEAGKRVSALPPAVDRAELACRLDTLRGTLHGVEPEAAQPDVQALAGLVIRARDLADAAGLLADDADAAAQRQIEFADLHERARTTLARAALEMRAAAGEPIYPLDWREWTGRCAAAQRALALMGDPAAPRTPQALEADGVLAASLASQAAALIEVVGQARARREALRGLLQQPCLAADRPWEARAVALHDAANLYAADNWAAADRVPYLRADAADLADRHGRWVPREPWLPLPVDTLPQRLEAVAHLAEALQTFQPALERIGAALAALRASEAETREALAGCCRDLAHLVDAVHQARPAYERPVTRHLGLMRQLVQHGQVLEASFARRERGTVAGKVQRAERWARAVQARLKPACRDLNAAAGAARTALAAEVDTLSKVLRLDADPAVRSAVACVQSPRPARRKVRGSPLARAAAITAYANALAADCQATDQARRELAAATRGLPAPLETWRTARDEAQAAWDRLESSCRALAAGWPPLGCDAGRPGRLRDTARLAREAARREEERLVGTRHASEAAARLQSLAEAHRRAAAAAVEAEVAARQAHARVQAAAGALDAARGRARSPEVDAEIERLKRQWTRRPPAEDEATGELERLRRRLTSV